MGDDTWVVLLEHLMPTSWIPIDAGGVRLLFFEAVLKDQGIEVAFDPFRPGEGGGFTRDCAQPVRLMVKAPDVERSRALLAESAAGSESDNDDDSDVAEIPAADQDLRLHPEDDGFDGWK